MGVTVTKPDLFTRWLEKLGKELHQQIIIQFSYLGQEAVNMARDRGAEESWIDRTGNLRSSIGAAVLDKGRQVMATAFETVNEGAAGSAKGQALIETLAQYYADTFALVVVAGMEYAQYVEARDNKDVLASTEQWVRHEVHGRLEDAVMNAAARMKKVKIT